jgi:hypothetical protein
MFANRSDKRFVNPHLHKLPLQFSRLRQCLSPSRRRKAPCEGTNSPRLFTPGETKALAKSKVHQSSRAPTNERRS